MVIKSRSRILLRLTKSGIGLLFGTSPRHLLLAAAGSRSFETLTPVVPFRLEAVTTNHSSSRFALTSFQDELLLSSDFQSELGTYRRDRVVTLNNEARIIVK